MLESWKSAFSAIPVIVHLSNVCIHSSRLSAGSARKYVLAGTFVGLSVALLCSFVSFKRMRRAAAVCVVCTAVAKSCCSRRRQLLLCCPVVYQLFNDVEVGQAMSGQQGSHDAELQVCYNSTQACSKAALSCPLLQQATQTWRQQLLADHGQARNSTPHREPRSLPTV